MKNIHIARNLFLISLFSACTLQSTFSIGDGQGEPSSYSPDTLQSVGQKRKLEPQKSSSIQAKNADGVTDPSKRQGCGRESKRQKKGSFASDKSKSFTWVECSTWCESFGIDKEMYLTMVEEIRKHSSTTSKLDTPEKLKLLFDVLNEVGIKDLKKEYGLQHLHDYKSSAYTTYCYIISSPQIKEFLDSLLESRAYYSERLSDLEEWARTNRIYQRKMPAFVRELLSRQATERCSSPDFSDAGCPVWCQMFGITPEMYVDMIGALDRLGFSKKISKYISRQGRQRANKNSNFSFEEQVNMLFKWMNGISCMQIAREVNGSTESNVPRSAFRSYCILLCDPIARQVLKGHKEDVDKTVIEWFRIHQNKDTVAFKKKIKPFVESLFIECSTNPRISVPKRLRKIFDACGYFEKKGVEGKNPQA